MKSSFQDKLKALRDAPVAQTRVGLSEKQAQRREQERSMRQEVAINWLESLLTHHAEGIGIRQIAQLFVQHYTEDASQQLQSGASRRKLNLIVVDFLRHFLAPAPVPEELASAYILLSKSYGFAEDERQKVRSARYNLRRNNSKCAELESKIAELDAAAAAIRPSILAERKRLVAAKQSVEDRGTFMNRFSNEYNSELQAAQSDIDDFEVSRGAELNNIEIEREMLDTDLMMARRQQQSSAKVSSAILDSYQDALLTWLLPFDLDGHEQLPGHVIPAGSYWRGSSEGQVDEQPLKTVRLSSPLWVSNIPITQGIFTAVTGYNPSARADLQRPVEMLSWYDAVEFCNILSELEGFDPAYKLSTVGDVTCRWEANGYRLPTEAEWEIAARASDNMVYSGADQPAQVAWTLENAHNKTQRVRRRRPNSWGLYDMSGNVWEWCWDGYQAGYYAESPKRDPRGPEHFNTRVLRGGSATLPHDRARVSNRYQLPPNIKDAMIGFRVVRRVDVDHD